MAAPQPPPPISDHARVARIGVNLGYASGNLGKSIVWTSFESFLLFYLVTFVGFSPLAAGVLLAGAMVWDGLADIIVGYFADRRGRSDMLGKLILIGAPLCGTAFWAIFALPAHANSLAIVATVAACRIGYTLCDIGHNTLLVRVSSSPRDASMVSGLRLIFSAAGAGLVGLASSYALSAPLSADQRGSFAPYALVGGIIYLFTLVIAMGVTRTLPAASPSSRHTRPGRLLAQLWHNRAYRRVLALMAVQSSLIPLFSRSLPFYGEIAHGDAAWAGPALSTMTLAQALSLPGWILLSRRLSSQNTLRIAYGVMIVGMPLLQIPAGYHSDLLPLIVVGISNGGINMAIWALLAISIRRGHGSGSEALPIGIFLATLKACSGIGGAILSLAVSWQNVERGSWCAGGSPILWSALALPIIGSILCLCLLAKSDMPESR